MQEKQYAKMHICEYLKLHITHYTSYHNWSIKRRAIKKCPAICFAELDGFGLLRFENNMRSSSPTIIGASVRIYSATILAATFPGCLFKVCLTNTSYLSPPPARNDDNKT